MSLVSISAGSRVSRLRTSSMAHIPPMPRISPTSGHFFCHSCARVSNVLPIALERCRNSLLSIISMAASAAAHDARLHFIGDENDAVFAADLLNDAEKFFGRSDEAAFAKNGLDDHRCNRIRGHKPFESVFKRVCAGHFA